MKFQLTNDNLIKIIGEDLPNKFENLIETQSISSVEILENLNSNTLHLLDLDEGDKLQIISSLNNILLEFNIKTKLQISLNSNNNIIKWDVHNVTIPAYSPEALNLIKEYGNVLERVIEYDQFTHLKGGLANG